MVQFASNILIAPKTPHIQRVTAHAGKVGWHRGQPLRLHRGTDIPHPPGTQPTGFFFFMSKETEAKNVKQFGPNHAESG